MGIFPEVHSPHSLKKIGEMFCVRLNLYGIVFFYQNGDKNWDSSHGCTNVKKKQDKAISGSKVHNLTLHVVTIF